jgi:hypothetical protein
MDSGRDQFDPVKDAYYKAHQFVDEDVLYAHQLNNQAIVGESRARWAKLVTGQEGCFRPTFLSAEEPINDIHLNGNSVELKNIYATNKWGDHFVVAKKVVRVQGDDLWMLRQPDDDEPITVKWCSREESKTLAGPNRLLLCGANGEGGIEIPLNLSCPSACSEVAGALALLQKRLSAYAAALLKHSTSGQLKAGIGRASLLEEIEAIELIRAEIPIECLRQRLVKLLSHSRTFYAAIYLLDDESGKYRRYSGGAAAHALFQNVMQRPDQFQDRLEGECLTALDGIWKEIGDARTVSGWLSLLSGVTEAIESGSVLSKVLMDRGIIPLLKDPQPEGREMVYSYALQGRTAVVVRLENDDGIWVCFDEARDSVLMQPAGTVRELRINKEVAELREQWGSVLHIRTRRQQLSVLEDTP